MLETVFFPLLASRFSLLASCFPLPASRFFSKQAIQEIVDMPDSRRLSTGKRESHFDFLTEDEPAGMEEARWSGAPKELMDSA